MGKWLSIVGIGEDGLVGVNPVGRSLIAAATVLVGGDRHLAMLPPDDPREKIPWSSPLEDSIQEIIHRRGQAVCLLASGDPLCYGIGTTLLRRIPIDEMTIVPAPSAFSLACARLGWSLPEVETVSLCGRDPALLHSLLYPHAKILVLSADRHTPAVVARILTEKGFGASQMVILEHMGGSKERQITAIADSWQINTTPPNLPLVRGGANKEITNIADLNTIAITCLPSPQGRKALRPYSPGLPDNAYHHDGQLTKREVRAITLAALAPLPGQLLWDVGAGCGSISIEWLRSHRHCRAIAIEQHPQRLQYIADNATALGTPQLQIIAGTAPAILKDLPIPDAIFIGGGLTIPNLLDTCWSALRPGGRLVANTVTVESELVLLQKQQELGGELTRIAIQRAEPVGKFLGWKGMAIVTQWLVVKFPSTPLREHLDFTQGTSNLDR